MILSNCSTFSIGHLEIPKILHFDNLFMKNQKVSVKLNALRRNVAGKRIVLIDDSIVRGTTMRRLVTMLRRAGAAEVHIRIASPPVQHACYFGMDYPSRNDLAGRLPDIFPAVHGHLDSLVKFDLAENRLRGR